MCQSDYRAGYVAGKTWTIGKDVRAIRGRIAEYERGFPNGILDLLLNVNDAYTPAERLYLHVIVDDPDNATREDAAAFWWPHEGANDLDFLHGFASGIRESATERVNALAGR